MLHNPTLFNWVMSFVIHVLTYIGVAITGKTTQNYNNCFVDYSTLCPTEVHISVIIIIIMMN